MHAYFAVIHKDEGSAYGVSWPDLPGCTSAAESLGELDAMAREALHLHLEGMREDGEALPQAKGFEEVYSEGKDDDGFYAVILVTVPEVVKKQRVQLRVSEIDLALIDSAAEARRQDRTEFMVSASKRVALEGA